MTMHCKRISMILLIFMGVYLSSVVYAIEPETYTMERSYYLIIHTRGMVYDLQVNGLNINSSFGVQFSLKSTLITNRFGF